MYYNFWKQYQSIVTPDIEVQFDTRLHNVIMKLELFFKACHKRDNRRKYKVLFSRFLH